MPSIIPDPPTARGAGAALSEANSSPLMERLRADLKERAATLIEALPYLQRFQHETVVLKYGGHAMTEPSLQQAVMQDLVLLGLVGIRCLVVHGGGPEISHLMDRVGKESSFVDGLRVTDEETVELAEMALVGKVSKQIVQYLNQHGGRGIGLSGKDGAFMTARKLQHTGPDLGLVGTVEAIDPTLLDLLTRHGYTPVISSIAPDAEGTTYNINADHVAGRIAVAVGAAKLIMLTDVRGVLADVNDESSLVAVLSASEARQLKQKGAIAAGMVPKIDACLDAVENGVERAHIIDGRIPHALLMELFTDQGIGTMIVPDSGR